jgi:hypothetical protein
MRYIQQGKLSELQKFEELGHEIARGNAFAGFTDALLHDSKKTGRCFPPTFKTLRHKRTQYTTQRIPSWYARCLSSPPLCAACGYRGAARAPTRHIWCCLSVCLSPLITHLSPTPQV